MLRISHQPRKSHCAEDSALYTTSNIQEHSRLPTTVLFLDGEVVKRNRLYIGALMMPRDVQRLAGSFRFQKIYLVPFFDLDAADAQQKALGILEVNKLLQKIEQQHVDLVVRQFDVSCFVRFNRIQIVDHHVHRRVGRSEEHTSELQSHSDLVCRLLLE